MALTEYEQIQALKSKVLKLEFNGELSYIKGNYSLTEIIGERLCTLLGIKCAHYNAFLINDTYYVASRDLNLDGHFILAKSFLLENDNNIPSIIDNFRNNFPNYEELKLEILKVFLFDIMFLNSDRYTENWGLLNNHIVILDNAGIFSNDSFTLMGESNQIVNIYESLESILNSFTECAEILAEFLKITPEYFSELLSEIEITLNVKIKKKKSYKYIYKKHYERVKEIFEKYRGDKYAR